jgi:hypothetical protein
MSRKRRSTNDASKSDQRRSIEAILAQYMDMRTDRRLEPHIAALRHFLRKHRAPNLPS